MPGILIVMPWGTTAYWGRTHPGWEGPRNRLRVSVQSRIPRGNLQGTACEGGA